MCLRSVRPNKYKLIAPEQNGRHLADDNCRCIYVNENYVFRLRLNWILFLKVQLTIAHIVLDNGLAPSRRQAIIWTNAHQIHWRIYAALGEDVLPSRRQAIIWTNAHQIHWRIYAALGRDVLQNSVHMSWPDEYMIYMGTAK